MLMLKATGLTKPSCCVLITLTWVSMLLLLQDLPPHQGAPMTEKSNSIVMAFSKIFYAEINFERRTRMLSAADSDGHTGKRRVPRSVF